jgi:enediyne biosynthesis protein E4
VVRPVWYPDHSRTVRTALRILTLKPSRSPRRLVLLLGLLFLAAAPLREASRQQAPLFLLENVARQAGIDFLQNNHATDMKYPYETLGGAVAAFDFDNDGLVDLFFLNGSPSTELVKTDPASFNRLYKNLGNGRFKDVTERSGLSGKGKKGYPQGVATGDYNNDGFVDLYITCYGDSFLYRNNGDGTFTDITAKAGVAMKKHPFKASAAWIDVDNDGHLDLFVTNYFQWTFEENADDYCGERAPGRRTYCSPDVFKPLPNVLFRNNGDGTFTDISEKAGLMPHLGKGMGVAIADYNNNGWMDIFVTNDKTPNFLYRNNGDLTFTEVGLEAGVSANENGIMVSAMGCDFKDFNNDGYPDIFYTDLVSECFTFFLNQKIGFFLDYTFPSRLGALSAPYSGWSNKFMDIDNDGWKDIFAAGSHVVDNVQLYSPKYRYEDPCLVYRNTRDGKVEDISRRLGPDIQELGAWRGVAVADFDNDGNLDIAVSRLNGPPALFMNRGSGKNWVILNLKGTRSNRDAIGAKVKVVTPSGLTQYDHVTTANGIYSASDKRLHFGLGAEKLKSVEIRWPSGKVQVLEGLAANRRHDIVEPE